MLLSLCLSTYARNHPPPPHKPAPAPKNPPPAPPHEPPSAGAVHADHVKHDAVKAAVRAQQDEQQAKREAKEAHWAAREAQTLAIAEEAYLGLFPPPPSVDTFIALEQQAALVAEQEKPKKTWAVLVCGSKGWDNYRHQASLFRMYGLLRRGIPEQQIITMFYDDIATHPNNQFPGKVRKAALGFLVVVNVKILHSRKLGPAAHTVLC